MIIVLNLFGNEVEFNSKEEIIIKKIVKILQFSQSNEQSKVWPGYDLTQTPIIITFKNGHVFILNHESSDSALQVINIDNTKVLFSAADHWGVAQSSFNPNFFFENKNAYVFNLDQALINAQKPLHVLVHERFHQYEFQKVNPPSCLGNYQDHLNAENLALAKLEEKTLIEFMRAKGHPTLQEDYLKDFIAINSMRRLFIRTPSIAWEDHQQVMEGLADYVGYKMMDILNLVDNFDGYKELTKALQKEFVAEDYSDHAIKWRHYTIGASLGYILDFLQIPKWKNQIEDGASLQDLLNEAVVISPEERESRFEKAKILLGWDEIYHKISKFTNEFRNEVETLLDSYDKLEGILISIDNPGTGLSGSGSNERMLYLQDGSTLSIKENLKAADEDNLWKLHLDNIPYLFKTPSGAMELKVNSEAAIIIDQKHYSLKEWISNPKKKGFRDISIKGNNIDFISADLEGMLIVDEKGRMSIYYH